MDRVEERFSLVRLRKDSMKRIVIAVFGALAFTLLSAASALAQSNIPPDDIGGEVVHPPGAAPGTTAFTGANITVWMLVAVALFALGAVLLFAARRRARGART